MATSKLFVSQDYIKRAEDSKFAIAFARIETHYFVHGGWFRYDGQLINEADILQKHDIPGIIVQGRYDCVCPMKSALNSTKSGQRANLSLCRMLDTLARARNHFRIMQGDR